jgi:hypothetical protein
MTPRALIALAAAASLAACNNAADRRAADSRICTPFPEAANTGASGQPTAIQPPADAAAAVDDCLHRWGYTLAGTSDSAEAVAQAVMAACTGALSRWNQQGLTAGGVLGAQPTEAPSLVTGQPSNPMAEHYSYAQNRALFYVVQGRAGKCAAPTTRPGQATR